MRKLERIKTQDGSDTFYIAELNEHYHSIHGAKQESEHVYIKSGLDYYVQNNSIKEIFVLEVGFGTGLNVLLAFLWADKNKIKLHLTTIEPFPIPEIELSEYNYNIPDINIIAKKIHSAKWNESTQISDYFILEKLNVGLENYIPNKDFDLVFFDAFAPEKQPEMWTLENFNKVFAILLNKGTLVTYCAKGVIRRRFEEVGFKAHRIQGPPGKREMLRCIKII